MTSIISDPYDRKARLYPALLSIMVPALAMLLVVPTYQNQLASMASVVVGLGGTVLLSSIGRERGKRLESLLFREWGGAPTTQLLLRSKSNLDPISIERYQAFLESRIAGLSFLGLDEERSNLNRAVEVCDSAIRWLREATRDRNSFSLIFAENINYGFRRNLLGVKPFAIASLFATLMAVGAHAWYNGSGDANFVSIESWLASILTIIALVFWTFFVTADFVKTTAFAYASALLAACDSPHLRGTHSTIQNSDGSHGAIIRPR